MRFNPRKYPLFHEPSGIYYRRDVYGTYFVHSSEIFWVAANKFLAACQEDHYYCLDAMKYSCIAVETAIRLLCAEDCRDSLFDVMRNLAEQAGINPNSGSVFGRNYPGIPRDKEHIQQERYMLLMFQYQHELTDGSELAFK